MKVNYLRIINECVEKGVEKGFERSVERGEQRQVDKVKENVLFFVKDELEKYLVFDGDGQPFS